MKKKEFVLLDFKHATCGIDIRAGVWHALFSLEPDTLLYEAKPGPYTPLTDKDFAPWSPRDDTPEAATFLSELEEEFRRHWNLPPRTSKKAQR